LAYCVSQSTLDYLLASKLTPYCRDYPAASSFCNWRNLGFAHTFIKGPGQLSLRFERPPLAQALCILFQNDTTDQLLNIVPVLSQDDVDILHNFSFQYDELFVVGVQFDSSGTPTSSGCLEIQFHDSFDMQYI